MLRFYWLSFDRLKRVNLSRFRWVNLNRPYRVTLTVFSNSVRLVMYAFQNAHPGDIFVQKAPAATIETLALALKDLFHAPNDIKIIGARHGEKMYESLCGKEEMSKAEDLGDFYRIPADFRDLNYTKYRATEPPRLQDKEYNSNNTRRLDVEQLKELLLTLPYVQNELETH